MTAPLQGTRSNLLQGHPAPRGGAEARGPSAQAHIPLDAARLAGASVGLRQNDQGQWACWMGTVARRSAYIITVELLCEGQVELACPFPEWKP